LNRFRRHDRPDATNPDSEYRRPHGSQLIKDKDRGQADW
jgi:hypothetical protein